MLHGFWRRNCQPTPISSPENSVDRRAWWATVHGVTKSWTWLNDSHTHTHTHTQSIFIYLFGCAGFPGGSDGKASACSAEDRVLIPGVGRSPGEGNDNPLQYSCLENPMDGGAWYNPCGLYGHKESDTTEWLHFHFLFTWLLVFFHFVLYLFSFFYDLLEMFLIEHLRDKE